MSMTVTFCQSSCCPVTSAVCKQQNVVHWPMPQLLYSNQWSKLKQYFIVSTSLIQIELGCLPLSEFSLSQDTTRVFRTAARVTKCKYVVVERSTIVSIWFIAVFGCARRFFVCYIKHVAPGDTLCQECPTYGSWATSAHFGSYVCILYSVYKFIVIISSLFQIIGMLLKKWPPLWVLVQ